MKKARSGELYMHKSQAEQNIPSDIYQKSLRILRNEYPDFNFNCVCFQPKKHIVRFDYSKDFNTITEPGIEKFIAVDYINGTTRIGKTSAVWHGRGFWVDDDYSQLPTIEMVGLP